MGPSYDLGGCASPRVPAACDRHWSELGGPTLVGGGASDVTDDDVDDYEQHHQLPPTPADDEWTAASRGCRAPRPGTGARRRRGAALLPGAARPHRSTAANGHSAPALLRLSGKHVGASASRPGWRPRGRGTSSFRQRALRRRAHSLQLPEHSTRLSDSNFLTRTLYKNTY